MPTTTAEFHFRVLYLLARGRVVQPDVIREEYDRLSPTYDRHFSAHVARRSRTLVRRLALPAGARVLDLASGTGTLSLAIAEAVGGHGEVIGVDQSPGMLAVARDKRDKSGLRNIRFVEADMREALDSLPGNSFDAVCCGWAIGYVNPVGLLTAARKKLRPGGKVGLIENTRETLAPVRKTATRVARTLPRHLEQIMDLHRRLPTGESHMARMFRQAGLRTARLWEGSEEFKFNCGRDVLDWVLQTGASAGFSKMMATEARTECDSLFIKYIEDDYLKDGSINVAHCYVAGIARKDGGTECAASGGAAGTCEN